MAILDNYMFRPLLAIFRGTRLFIIQVHQEPPNLTLATRLYRASSQIIPPHTEITLHNKAHI